MTKSEKMMQDAKICEWLEGIVDNLNTENEMYKKDYSDCDWAKKEITMNIAKIELLDGIIKKF